ncbi:hypothetical protein EDB86DRAFT_2833049 [Lactarius hatsudake]|nr:hypothetical protein EDB86DRAFT_2833049 [Lactarius hatsudake]
MTYFDASFGIANPRTFSAPLGAPTSVEDRSTTQSGHLDGVDSIFDCPEERTFYDSGTFPHDTTGFAPEGDSYVPTGDMSTNTYLRCFTTTINATASTSATAAPLFADYGTYGFDLPFEPLGWDHSALPTPSLTNASSIPSPPRDDIGGHINTPHAYEAPASNFVLLSDLLSDFGTLGTVQAEQVSRAPPYWDGINFTPQTQRDDAPTSAPVGMPEHIPPSSWLNYADNTAAPINVLTATMTAGAAGRARTVLGKRARERGSSGTAHKRRRPSASWVLEEAEGSAKRTHHTPATSAQERDKPYTYDSTVQSREARTITAQGLYFHPLLGSSAQQEMVRFSEQEQLEGRGPSKTQHDSCGMVPPHTEGSAEGQEGLYAIPSTLTERQRLMLRTTADDVERGAVHVIKCKLCPAVELGSWQCFRRHCNTSEDHPAELTFCNRCGDHFGRRDSEKRHSGKRYQEECRTTPRDQAEWKKKTVKRLFEDFSTKIELCLRTGEELGPRFAAITQQAMQQAKVPTTSKKQKKIRLEGDSERGVSWLVYYTKDKDHMRNGWKGEWETTWAFKLSVGGEITIDFKDQTSDLVATYPTSRGVSMTFHVIANALPLFEGSALHDPVRFRKRCRDNLLSFFEGIISGNNSLSKILVWLSCPFARNSSQLSVLTSLKPTAPDKPGLPDSRTRNGGCDTSKATSIIADVQQTNNENKDNVKRRGETHGRSTQGPGCNRRVEKYEDLIYGTSRRHWRVEPGHTTFSALVIVVSLLVHIAILGRT